MTTVPTPVGVLVMAYGTPRSLEEVEPYYTHIRHGNPPTPELLAELIGRYEAIGGVSPLNEITEAQAAGMEASLNAASNTKFRIYLGMKHTHPFIDEGIRQMAEDGIQHAVTLVLAPHFSKMSVGAYQKAADAAAEAFPELHLYHIDHWHLDPLFIRLLGGRVQQALETLSSADDTTPHVVFTAHSLPERIVAENDPYPAQLEETGHAVAQELQLSNYSFGWQSAGRTKDKWIGPDILDVLRRLAEEGEKQVVICPAGFVSDHLEVLYDVDIECQNLARHLGLTLVRTQSFNADKDFTSMLADVVLRRAQTAEVVTES